MAKNREALGYSLAVLIISIGSPVRLFSVPFLLSAFAQQFPETVAIIVFQ